MVWNSFHACLPCFYLSLIAQTCPNLPKIAFTLFFHCLNKKMWLQKVLALLSLALVISLIQCTGVCWEVALEPIELPFILSGVCSPSEANYCSNPFEVFCCIAYFKCPIYVFRSPSSMAISRSYPGHLVKFCSSQNLCIDSNEKKISKGFEQ